MKKVAYHFIESKLFNSFDLMRNSLHRRFKFLFRKRINSIGIITYNIGKYRWKIEILSTVTPLYIDDIKNVKYWYRAEKSKKK